MGGKSLMWACAIVLALAFPVYAQTRLNETTAARATRTDKVYLGTTELKDKVQKRFQSGTDVFVQEAERIRRTRHYRVDTYTTYEKRWQEYVTKTRNVWAVVGREWVYPCPGPGYWRDVYGWKSESYDELENRSQTYEARTGSTTLDETLPEEIGSYRTVSRISLNGSGDSASLLAATSGRGAAGAEIGFSGDTGNGAAAARQASAGKSKALSGASKGTSSKGTKFLDLAGSWSGGLTIQAGKGPNHYYLRLPAGTIEVTYDPRKGKLEATSKKGPSVDLAVDAEGKTLAGTLGGEAAQFRRQ